MPFGDYQPEVRKLITRPTASKRHRVPQRPFRAAARRRGSFPDTDSAMKVLFLTIYRREKNRPNPTGRINNWTTILNELTVAYGDRLSPRLNQTEEHTQEDRPTRRRAHHAPTPDRRDRSRFTLPT